MIERGPLRALAIAATLQFVAGCGAPDGRPVASSSSQSIVETTTTTAPVMPKAPLVSTTTTTTTLPPPPPTEETVPASSPSGVTSSVAEAPLAELQPCPVEWETVQQGICYAKQADFHILRVDLADPNISVCPAYTVSPGSLGTLSEAAKRMNAVVAINASFFEDGQALGPLACDGQWVSDNPYSLPVLEYLTDGTTHIHPTEEALAADVTAMRFAVSGSHFLVSDGQQVTDFGEDENYTLYGHHNRTAIGIDDNHFLFMVVTAAGNTVTMPELTQFMSSLGVRSAVNLDGGKSSNGILQGGNVIYGGGNNGPISTGVFVMVNS